jgi:hypothetical protein
MQQEPELIRETVIERGQSSSQTGHQSVGRDKELQLSRRLDWRFLLPDPRLRQLAYLGPEKGSLLQALQYFSDPSLIISWSDLSDYRPEVHSGFDLVIMHTPEPASLDKTHSIIRDGGYLYWEIERTNLNQPWHLQHFKDYVTPLASLGFDDIRVSWHRPDFDSCLEIIPLDKKVALRYVFTRHKGDLAGKIQVIAGKFLMKTDLLSRTATCISLVARKSSSAKGSK